VINNQDKFKNCQNIIELDLELQDFAGISNESFAGCKKLETSKIKSDSLTDLPDGLFKNQENLQSLELSDDNLKLRVSPFEGLENLSELKLLSMNLNQVEENFFRSLKIKKLLYFGNPNESLTFPIESLNSQETIEELIIWYTNMSQIPDNFGSILRSMKQLRKINFCYSLIRSAEAFVDLPIVDWISLYENNIEELPANAFKGCPRMTGLGLSHNPIKALRGDEFSELSGLKVLNLEKTKLTSIAPTTFHPLKFLEQLYLGGSFEENIKIIEKELFKNSTNLKEIDLRSNNIEAIHLEAFENLRLVGLYLSRNKCVDTDFYYDHRDYIKDKLQNCFKKIPIRLSDFPCISDL
jgi:Leucine-rich repeat (LRR) protein